MVSWRRKWAARLFAAPCQASVRAGGLCDCLGAVSQAGSRKETQKVNCKNAFLFLIFVEFCRTL